MDQPSNASVHGRAFELDFELTNSDLVRLAEHMAQTGQFYREQMLRARRLLAAVFVVAALLFAVLERDPAATVIMTAALAVVGWLMWVTWPKRWRSVIRKQSERQVAIENSAAVLGPKRYKVDADGISYSGVYSGGYALWPAIMLVTADDAAVYLHVSQASAHIVPLRAFGSAAEFASFVAQVEAWYSDVAQSERAILRASPPLHHA